MGMNDSETIALIGGGHAFGKTHGACPKAESIKWPNKADPKNLWPAVCGDGKGKEAFTSGFEGPWTTAPTQWDNEVRRV
jgi:catalase (peroxidase I)